MKDGRGKGGRDVWKTEGRKKERKKETKKQKENERK